MFGGSCNKCLFGCLGHKGDLHHPGALRQGEDIGHLFVGSDPVGAQVEFWLRRGQFGEAGMDARAAAAAIAAEDQKARMDLVSAMKSAPPPPAAMAATAALQSRAETADRTAADAKEALRRAEEALRSAEEARSSRAGTVRAAGVGLAVLAGGLLVSRALKGDR